MRITEPALLGKQLRQGTMSPKLFVVPVKRGCGDKGRLEVVYGFLRLAIGVTDIAKDSETMADLILIAFAQEEIERPGCGFFCGVKLLIAMQRLSELSPGFGLSEFVVEPFVSSQRFLRLLYSFLVEP